MMFDQNQMQIPGGNTMMNMQTPVFAGMGGQVVMGQNLTEVQGDKNN